MAAAFVLVALLAAAAAEFTEQGCWQRNCLVRNDAGTLCFIASANGIPSAECSDRVLARVLQTHLSSNIGLSIAYYDQRAHFLCSVTWPVPSPLPFPIYVCMSGRRADIDGHRTVCRMALRDDDVRSPEAHDQECAVEAGQVVVTDGCYAPAAFPPDAVDQKDTQRSTSFLDSPVLVHMFFVLSAVLTVAALVSAGLKYRKHVSWMLSRAGTKSARASRLAVGAVVSVVARRLPSRVGSGSSVPEEVACVLPLFAILSPDAVLMPSAGSRL